MYQPSRPISNSGMPNQQQEPSREELLKHLVDELAARKAVDLPSVRRWQKVKAVMLIALAAFAFVQYYVIDVMAQIMALRENVYFLPVAAPAPKSKA